MSEKIENEKVVENELSEEKTKPKLNNAVMLFAVVVLGVGIWFGSSMIDNAACNGKAVKVMKEIKVPVKDVKVQDSKKSEVKKEVSSDK